MFAITESNCAQIEQFHFSQSASLTYKILTHKVECLQQREQILQKKNSHVFLFIHILLGYVYTGSDMFRSVWNRIHYDRDLLCLHGTGLKLERIGSIWDRLHKWTHLVPDSRSDPHRIHQISYKAHPYQFRTRFQTDPVQCKRCRNCQPEKG